MTVTQIDPSRLGLQDALDLAILVEEEAEERYRDFAAQLDAHGTPAAARCFAELAGEERRHHDELLTRRRKRFGDAAPKVHRGMLWDIEAPGFEMAHAYMNSRRALTVALGAEGKARAFFAALIPKAVDAEAKALFTELEAEEREHQDRLKAQLALLPAESGGTEPGLADGPVAQ